MAVRYPVVPNNIIVHLGKPSEAAKDVSVPFPEYIKNVASSEIYPTWPEASLRANILVIVSFALNRIYNEFFGQYGSALAHKYLHTHYSPKQKYRF